MAREKIPREIEKIWKRLEKQPVRLPDQEIEAWRQSHADPVFGLPEITTFEVQCHDDAKGMDRRY
nr:hypothetical protein [Verrucomicrobiota bacterium]